MDYQDYFKFFAALIFVLSLMGGLAFLLKHFGFAQGGGLSSPLSKVQKRLKIIEIQALDPRRKAVLIQRDDVQHLVLLGPAGETVIETNIPIPKEFAKKEAEQK